jgi:hypothetical protein
MWRQGEKNGSLKINFAGEPAVDGGGPRREFFTGENFSTCMVFLGFTQNIWKVLLHPFYQTSAHTSEDSPFDQ